MKLMQGNNNDGLHSNDEKGVEMNITSMSSQRIIQFFAAVIAMRLENDVNQKLSQIIQ